MMPRCSACLLKCSGETRRVAGYSNHFGLRGLGWIMEGKYLNKAHCIPLAGGR